MALKPYEGRRVYLTRWVIQFIPDEEDVTDFNVKLCGLMTPTPVGPIEETEEFYRRRKRKYYTFTPYTTDILDTVLGPKLIEMDDKEVVVLVDGMSYEEGLKLGYPSMFIDHFRFGFPPAWEFIISQFYGSRVRAITNGETLYGVKSILVKESKIQKQLTIEDTPREKKKSRKRVVTDVNLDNVPEVEELYTSKDNGSVETKRMTRSSTKQNSSRIINTSGNVNIVNKVIDKRSSKDSKNNKSSNKKPQRNKEGYSVVKEVPNILSKKTKLSNENLSVSIKSTSNSSKKNKNVSETSSSSKNTRTRTQLEDKRTKNIELNKEVSTSSKKNEFKLPKDTVPNKTGPLQQNLFRKLAENYKEPKNSQATLKTNLQSILKSSTAIKRSYNIPDDKNPWRMRPGKPLSPSKINVIPFSFSSSRYKDEKKNKEPYFPKCI
uniref:SANTA domain-containing protein n=1 Tax=Parastrongyloides trichosuri TaxID=131310 RepID=A0A0N4ZFN0_PARTI